MELMKAAHALENEKLENRMLEKEMNRQLDAIKADQEKTKADQARRNTCRGRSTSLPTLMANSLTISNLQSAASCHMSTKWHRSGLSIKQSEQMRITGMTIRSVSSMQSVPARKWRKWLNLDEKRPRR
jgi:hypothetical protein